MYIVCLGMPVSMLFQDFRELYRVCHREYMIIILFTFPPTNNDLGWNISAFASMHTKVNTST